MHIAESLSSFRKLDRPSWKPNHPRLSDRLKPEYQFENWIGPLWRSIKREDQESLVGREKVTGCPFIGLDGNGRLFKDNRCPVRGTFEVQEKGNESFREHPKYGTVTSYGGLSNKSLQFSHIGRTNKVDKISPAMNESYRIFRQGFEFLEPIAVPPFFKSRAKFCQFSKPYTEID